jgi:hypothetical protein
MRFVKTEKLRQEGEMEDWDCRDFITVVKALRCPAVMTALQDLNNRALAEYKTNSNIMKKYSEGIRNANREMHHGMKAVFDQNGL